jgi:hypothetical protein
MAADQPDAPPESPGRGNDGNFNLAKAGFETLIVAIGVLLALMVDEARQSRENRQLASEAIAAMRAELEENRWRLVRKLDLLHRAYLDLEADPGRAAQLVSDRRNQQVTPSDTAWVMTVETGALRLLSPADRSRFGMVYTANKTYYDILSQEMTYWNGLAAYPAEDRSPQTLRERDQAIRLWKNWANRVALGVCISAARIELAFQPQLSREKLWAACRAYRVTSPPADLYSRFGLPMPPTRSFL